MFNMQKNHWSSHVSVSLLETIHLKQLDEGYSLKYSGMGLKLHFWYEEKHQTIKSNFFRSAHRGSLGSEILFPGRRGASPFLELSSRAEVSAKCEALLVHEGSANVLSLNKQDRNALSLDYQHNCMSSQGFFWHSGQHQGAGKGSRAGTAKKGQNFSCTAQCWSSIQSSTVAGCICVQLLILLKMLTLIWLC